MSLRSTRRLRFPGLSQAPHQSLAAVIGQIARTSSSSEESITTWLRGEECRQVPRDVLAPGSQWQQVSQAWSGCSPVG